MLELRASPRHLPLSTDMPVTLKIALENLNVPQLKDLASHLPGEKPPRKQELVDMIASAMLGTKARALWDQLDEFQRAAVAVALHEDRGSHDPRRFFARYGANPAFAATGVKSSGRYSSKASALGLFILYDPHERSQRIPTDLQAVLRAFVPPPVPIELSGAENLPEAEALTVRLTERDAAQEALILMRTLEQTRVQVSEKTALPGAASLRALSEKLVSGDYYPWVEKKHKWEQEIGPIRAFAWPMLLQAGGLATRTGNRLTLTPAGVRALSAPPAETLRTLWRKWQKSTLLDEYSRVDVVKGQGGKGRVMTAVVPRRVKIEDALMECPLGRWVSVDAFSRFMCAAGMDFEVTHDPWRLYVCSSDYGALGYDGNDGWNILQERYIFAFLFEYAATLGLIDVAFVDPTDARRDFHGMWGVDDLAFFSRYDGLRHIRLTPLGAYILGLTNEYRPSVVSSDLALSVLPSLQIKVTRGTPAVEESLLLDNWAESVAPGIWRLDRERTLSAIEKGFDIGELRAFLERGDDMPLPETVDSFIRNSEHNGKALKLLGTAVVVECRDAETARTIAQHKETSALCLATGGKTLVVRNEHLEKFRQRVRVLGFGLRCS